ACRARVLRLVPSDRGLLRRNGSGCDVHVQRFELHQLLVRPEHLNADLPDGRWWWRVFLQQHRGYSLDLYVGWEQHHGLGELLGWHSALQLPLERWRIGLPSEWRYQQPAGSQLGHGGPELRL